MKVPSVAVIKPYNNKPNEKFTYVNTRNIKELWVEHWTGDNGKVRVDVWKLDSDGAEPEE